MIRFVAIALILPGARQALLAPGPAWRWNSGFRHPFSGKRAANERLDGFSTYVWLLLRAPSSAAAKLRLNVVRPDR